MQPLTLKLICPPFICTFWAVIKYDVCRQWLDIHFTISSWIKHTMSNQWTTIPTTTTIRNPIISFQSVLNHTPLQQCLLFWTKWVTLRWQTPVCCVWHVSARRHHAPGSHQTGSTRSAWPTSGWALDLEAASSPPPTPLRWSQHRCVWEDNMHHGQKRVITENSFISELPKLQLLHISLSLIQ